MDTTDSATRVVVCDAGPLIHLDEMGCTDLLADFAQVLVPTAVWDEVAHHRPTALECPSIVFLRTAVKADLPDDLAALSRLFTLHLGELQALQIATEQSVDMLLTDDTAARLAARQSGILVHGTLGILLRSIRRGQRTATQVVATLRTLSTVSTLHIKPSLLDEIIHSVEQRK